MTLSNTEYTPVEQLSYEQAFAELESSVAALESGQHSLDEALRLFDRGQELVRYCRQPAGQGRIEGSAPQRRSAGGIYTSGVSLMSLQGVFSNTILIAGVAAWVIAQTIKVPVDYLRHQRWNWLSCSALADAQLACRPGDGNGAFHRLVRWF